MYICICIRYICICTSNVAYSKHVQIHVKVGVCSEDEVDDGGEENGDGGIGESIKGGAVVEVGRVARTGCR